MARKSKPKPKPKQAKPLPEDNWAYLSLRSVLDAGPEPKSQTTAPHGAVGKDDDTPPIKPGPKPHRDWPTLVAGWLIAVAAENPERLQNVDALVIEAKVFLHDRIAWAPKETKELRATIRELLRTARS